MIPIGYKWQLQFEFVLWRNVTGHVTVPMDGIQGPRVRTTISTLADVLQAPRRYIQNLCRRNDRRTSGKRLQIEPSQCCTTLLVLAHRPGLDRRCRERDFTKTAHHRGCAASRPSRHLAESLLDRDSQF